MILCSVRLLHSTGVAGFTLHIDYKWYITLYSILVKSFQQGDVLALTDMSVIALIPPLHMVQHKKCNEDNTSTHCGIEMDQTVKFDIQEFNFVFPEYKETFLIYLEIFPYERKVKN